MHIAICGCSNALSQKFCALMKPYLDGPAHVEYGVYTDISEFRADFVKELPDLLCLHVEFAENLNATLKLAKEFTEKNPHLIIFLISKNFSDSYEAFRLPVFQFFPEPLAEETFIQDFERALKYYRAVHNYYMIRQRNRETVISIPEILYIEVFGKRLTLHTAHESFSFSGTLSSQAARLKEHNFVKCHQSYLVNLVHVHSIDKNEIILRNSEVIPVSRNLRKSFTEAFERYITLGHI